MNDIKGVLATMGTGGAALVSWMPTVAAILRIGVSVAGIFAGIYAARYWHQKTKQLKDNKRKHRP